MLQEAEAAGFSYDRIHGGDSHDFDSMELDEALEEGLRVYDIVMDNEEYFTEKLENGTFDKNALKQLLSAMRDDYGLAQVFGDANRDDIAGVFTAVKKNRVPLGDFKPDRAPDEWDMNPALL
jgi:hypothetical protein